MQTTMEVRSFPKQAMQTCPLCGQEQVAVIRGLSHDIESNEIVVVADRGYSFCNCRNIFFTKWENIDKSKYNDDYYHKYECQDTKNVAEGEINKFLKIFKYLCPDIKTFFEVGAVFDYILDYVQNEGLDVCGLDIIKRPSKHKVINEDIEEVNLKSHINKKDVIWAAHILEHVKDPSAVLIKLRDMLTDDGLLYVAMPDTWYVDWDGNNPLKWDWIVNEHHILWNRDDFVDFAEEHGLECLHKERSMDLINKEDGTYFWKQDFKAIFKRK